MGSDPTKFVLRAMLLRMELPFYTNHWLFWYCWVIPFLFWFKMEKTCYCSSSNYNSWNDLEDTATISTSRCWEHFVATQRLGLCRSTVRIGWKHLNLDKNINNLVREKHVRYLLKNGYNHADQTIWRQQSFSPFSHSHTYEYYECKCKRKTAPPKFMNFR